MFRVRVSSFHSFNTNTCAHYLFRDSTEDRVLDGRPAQEIPADYMTVEKCIDGCKAAGFPSAGLEFGKECYCGDVAFPPGEYENLEDCNMPCLGDASEYVPDCLTKDISDIISTDIVAEEIVSSSIPTAPPSPSVGSSKSPIETTAKISGL